MASKMDINKPAVQKTINKKNTKANDSQKYQDEIDKVLHILKEDSNVEEVEKSFARLVIEVTVNLVPLQTWASSSPQKYVDLLSACVDNSTPMAMNVCRSICGWAVMDDSLGKSPEYVSFREMLETDNEKYVSLIRNISHNSELPRAAKNTICEGWFNLFHAMSMTVPKQMQYPMQIWDKFFESEDIIWLFMLVGSCRNEVPIADYSELLVWSRKYLEFLLKHKQMEKSELKNNYFYMYSLGIATIYQFSQCLEMRPENEQHRIQFVNTLLTICTEVVQKDLTDGDDNIISIRPSDEPATSIFESVMIIALSMLDGISNNRIIIGALQSNAARILDIYAKSFPEECVRTGECCQCVHILRTTAIRDIIIGSMAVTYPVIMKYAFNILLQLYQKHRMQNGISALLAILPYDPSKGKDCLEYMFHIVVDSEDDSVTTLANICYAQFTKIHVDRLEQLLSSGHNKIMWEALNIVSQNNHKVMRGRGQGYYNMVEPDVAISGMFVVNNILKNISCGNIDDSERILKLMKQQCEIMDNNTFTNDMLINWKDIAIAHPKSVQMYNTFLVDLIKTRPTVKANATRVYRIIGVKSKSCSVQ